MRVKLTAAAFAALLLSGCGSSDPPATPAACLQPGSSYVSALADAPGEVRLEGATPISSCLVSDQAAGALQTVGTSIVDAATALNAEVRRGDHDAAVSLGYLVGAVQEGASTTNGIHRDLVLRLDSSARYPGPGGKPFGAAFERAFGEGYASGQATG